MIVTKSLESFLISVFESSMFTFTIVKPVQKLNFVFSNILTFSTHLYYTVTIKRVTFNFEIFPTDFLLKLAVVLKVLHIKQVFFPHLHYLPALLVLGNGPSTK